MDSFALRGGGRRASTARRRIRNRTLLTLEGLEHRQLLTAQLPTAGPLGINIGSSLQYVDMMKDAGNWGPISQAPPTLDAEGWPTSDASILVEDARVNQPWNGPDPNAVAPVLDGTYHLSFHGQATVTPNWLGNFTVHDQVYNASTNTTTADLALVISPDYPPILDIFFNNTVNPASATGAGVTDVHLIRPGYAADTTQLFTNDILNALKPFGAIRYLNADGANAYGATVGGNGLLAPLDWSQRTLPDARSQTSTGSAPGQAWEYLVALANATNTDMWINVPGPATDDYVAQLASLVKDGDTVNGVAYAGLNPNLKVYLEYSNEVWGGIAAPTNYNQEATKEELAAGHSTLQSDGDTSTYDSNGRHYLERSMQVSNIFRGVFGGDPAHATIRPVLGWQEQNWQFYSQNLPWFESNYGAASRYFYGLGNANYFSPTDSSLYNSVDAAISSMAASEAQSVAITQDFTAVANFYGLKNVAYEGGPAIGANGYTPAGQNALATSRDPRMENLVKQNYLNWYAAGGDLAMYFDGPYEPFSWSPQNEWGAAEPSQASNPSLAAKYRGIVDVANSPPQAPSAGVLLSTGSSTALPIASDQLGQSFTAPIAGATYEWIVTAPAAGTYNLSTTTTANTGPGTNAQAGTVEVLLGDQSPIGAYAVGQSGTYGLGPVTLHAGLNVLAIEVVHGYWDATGSYMQYEFHPNSLTLTPAPPVPPAPIVADAGFEAASVAVGTYVFNPAGTAWAYSGGGITANNSLVTSANDNAPQGSRVAFLQTYNALSQSVENWAAGTYQINFIAAQRGSYGGSRQDFEVLVDGQVVSALTPASTSYQAYTTASFTVAAGAHTITFQGLNTAGGDNTALIDDVAVVPTSSPVTPAPSPSPGPSAPAIDDAGFESVSLPPWTGYTFDPAGSPWAYSGSAGVTSNGSLFTSANPDAPGGTQVAFLQAQGAMTQSIAGWAAGTYQVSFAAAQRGSYGGSRQDFEVLVDGQVVSAFTPASTSYQAYTTASFTVAAGAHTVTLQGLDTAGGDNTAFVDNVAIVPGS